MLSVIIPAYNAEKSVKRCLTSLQEQNYDDYECIIVNDGSLDSTLSIITQISKQDKRIRIVDSTNKGVSQARNLGLSISKGEYITFLDSDDILIPNSLTEIMKKIETDNSDILIFGYEREKFDGKVRSYRTIDSQFYLSHAVKNELWAQTLDAGLLNTCWGKIYRREVIQGIKFNRKMQWGEDSRFLFSAICKSKTISFSKTIGYRHISSHLSLDNRFDINKPKYINMCYCALFSFEKKLNINGKEWIKARDVKISREIFQAINASIYNNLSHKQLKKYLDLLFLYKRVRTSFKNGVLVDNNPLKLKFLILFNLPIFIRLYIHFVKQSHRGT